MNYQRIPFVPIAIGVIVLFAQSVAMIPNRCSGEERWKLWRGEQKRIQFRDPSQLRQVPVEITPQPQTVADFDAKIPEMNLALDEAIRIALKNSEVVRLLAGVTASTSGRTIYDTAIANSAIDQQRGVFDPQFRANQAWNQNETPNAVVNPLAANPVTIGGSTNEGYALDLGLSQRNLLGGTSEFNLRSNSAYVTPGPGTLGLNPQRRTATEFRYTQPLLNGAGLRANQANILLSRIDTERSFFQYKDSVQGLVRGVIEAYWALVLARTDLWARQQQVKQAEFANERSQARRDAGEANASDVAQTELALENFKASLLNSQATLLQRQGALLNILGFPPFESSRMVPTTPMQENRLPIDWEAVNELAQRQRPDIIELKLILDADTQRLILADNGARAQLDGVALYRWNGLEGEVPVARTIRNENGDFADWALGVNFSVPLGLRASRAALRAQQLVIRRDRANLQQGLHQMQHLLALNLRNLDQFYAQYERFTAVRTAARKNLDQQLASYEQGIVQFIVVLQAIVDWGNSVSSQASALTQYNTELARLEQATGTILETHGVVFYEERFAAIGPLTRCGPTHCYPSALRAGVNSPRYEDGGVSAEQAFDLQTPRGVRDEDDSEPDNMKLDGEDVEFQDIDGKQRPLTDEEIDQLLPPKQSRRTLREFLKDTFRF